jgi:outer membrane protein OmpA-like peptidoglycan-associated protein
MNVHSMRRGALLAIAMLAVSAPGALPAQELAPAVTEDEIEVLGSLPDDLSGLAEGPEIKGLISERRGRELQVTSPDGTRTKILVADATEIKARGGFLGLGRVTLTAEALLNGLPVEVDTVRWSEGLVASRISFKNEDLETVAMIRGATDQRFGENEAAIVENAEGIERNALATEALRSRMGDIDQYNVKSTTNVYFDSGKTALTPQAKFDLCRTATEAEAMGNALLLVVGYTDSTGSVEINQQLSERRAGGVVNHLQQACGWKPWRMLTPTGMAESDPLASNDTEAGRAQNRRVSVNVLVSKAVDGS